MRQGVVDCLEVMGHCCNIWIKNDDHTVVCRATRKSVGARLGVAKPMVGTHFGEAAGF